MSCSRLAEFPDWHRRRVSVIFHTVEGNRLSLSQRASDSEMVSRRCYHAAAMTMIPVDAAYLLPDRLNGARLGRNTR